MTCKQIRELMPDLALGLTPAAGEAHEHLRTCRECAGKLEEIRKTMALLDEWQSPEPSPYFDTRLQARLREEKAKAPAGWLAWVRRPVFALAATVVLAVGITTLFRGDFFSNQESPDVASTVAAQPGTAVGDLLQLDKNHDLYADADVLDDLDIQPDATANP